MVGKQPLADGVETYPPHLVFLGLLIISRVFFPAVYQEARGQRRIGGCWQAASSRWNRNPPAPCTPRTVRQ